MLPFLIPFPGYCLLIDFSYVKKIRTLFFNKSYDFIFTLKTSKNIKLS